MTSDSNGLDRRTMLTAGLTGAVTLGIAACGAPDTQPSPSRGPGGGPAPTTAGSAAAATSTPPTRGTTEGTPTRQSHGTPAVLTTSGPDIASGPSTRAALALTFHGAGDPDLTTRVLRACAAHGARITVFAVGTWLSARPDLGHAVVAAGHDLGNHTWSHRTMPTLTPAAARSEVQRGADAVARIPGSNPLLFRPSGTRSSTRVIRAAAEAGGYHRCISYGVDPADYRDPGPDVVARRTLAGARPGAIVSLHLGHPGTAAALPTILAGLTDRGLEAVTMSELLA